MTFYTQPHVSQYAVGASVRLRRMGCTPTTGANGAAASTGGRVRKTGDQVLGLVPRADETDPSTPGWSLVDLDHAMASLKVPFEVRSGQGWAGVVAAHNKGQYVALQGDSDQFGNSTCSGQFDGDHCIGVHPDEDALGWWRIDDPICHTVRYEHPATLRRYAEKFWPSVRFGVFTEPVPKTGGDDMYEPFGAPQQPSNATAKRATKLYSQADKATGVLSGVSYNIPAGHVKRYAGPLTAAIAVIVHDRDSSVDGKSHLYGKAVDWEVKPNP